MGRGAGSSDWGVGFGRLTCLLVAGHGSRSLRAQRRLCGWNALAAGRGHISPFRDKAIGSRLAVRPVAHPSPNNVVYATGDSLLLVASVQNVDAANMD